jgi:predicted house-cleaning noncanonical NTP pyrophosphatase (MazG superfamily)
MDKNKELKYKLPKLIRDNIPDIVDNKIDTKIETNKNKIE